jgi:hypothetical protein
MRCSFHPPGGSALRVIFFVRILDINVKKKYDDKTPLEPGEA